MPSEIVNSTVDIPDDTVNNTVISEIDSRVTAKNGTVNVADGLRRRGQRGTRSWDFYSSIVTNTAEGATVVSSKAITTNTVTNTTMTRRSGGY